MKAQIYVNRHIVQANKKATKETGVTVDAPAIAVNTYLGSIYAKEVEFTDNCKLIQDATKARCSGATIWIESEFESLVIDGVKANRSFFKKTKELKTRNVPQKSEKNMLYIVDTLETRPFSGGKLDRKCPRVYFFEKNESILAHLNRRHYRPHQEYRKLLPKVYEQLDFPLGVKAKWSQYAGCSCPCSPGFTLKLPDNFSYEQDIFITVVMDLDEALASMAKEQESNQLEFDNCFA